VHVQKHQLYLLEQPSESFKIWSVIIRINTKTKSLIIKLGPGIFTAHAHSILLLQFSTDLKLFANQHDVHDITTMAWRKKQQTSILK